MLDSKIVPVVRDGPDYVIIENKAESRLAIRRPLSEMWKEIHNREGILVALEIIQGVA